MRTRKDYLDFGKNTHKKKKPHKQQSDRMQLVGAKINKKDVRGIDTKVQKKRQKNLNQNLKKKS